MENENKDKILKDAQYRKGLSIAFFNATNSAIALVTTGKMCDDAKMLDEVVRIRDFFLEEHKNYYANVIAQVGNNFDPKETIKKLESTKTISELSIMWRSISQDERDNQEIIECVKALKAEYEKQK